MRLDEVMTRNVVVVEPDEKIVEAARTMRARRISSALVVRDQRLVGIVTERDLAHKIVAEGVAPEDVRVADVMTPDPIIASAERDVWEALSLMNVKGVRHLPVCSTDGRPVGVVSINDIVSLAGSARVHVLLEGLDERTRARLAEILLWCADRIGLRREDIPALPGFE